MVQQKKSLKPIPPTIKEKKRYVEFELKTSQKLLEKDVKEQIWNTLTKLYGEIGVAKQKIWLISFDQKNNKGIIRCNLEYLDEVKTGLLFLKKIKEKPLIPKILAVSGSISKIKEE